MLLGCQHVQLKVHLHLVSRFKLSYQDPWIRQLRRLLLQRLKYRLRLLLSFRRPSWRIHWEIRWRRIRWRWQRHKRWLIWWRRARWWWWPQRWRRTRQPRGYQRRRATDRLWDWCRCWSRSCPRLILIQQMLRRRKLWL